MLPKLKRKSRLRYRKKSLVILAIICISSSTLYKICLIGENFYKKHYLLPEVEEFERAHSARHSVSTRDTLTIKRNSSSRQYVNNILTTSRIKHQLKQDFVAVKCSDSACSDLLSPSERPNYNACTISAARMGPLKISKCSFLNGTNRHPIGLASFPGSGNTWVRGLLQKVTGFCTGSLYCDRELRRRGFPGEGIQSGSVLVTKTHSAGSRLDGSKQTHAPCSNCTFQKVIFIIRDPFRAMIAEWNRQLLALGKTGARTIESHVLSVGKEYFGDNPKWVHFVEDSMKYWLKMVSYWILTWSLSHQLYVVKYEDILENSSQELSKMLRFIGVHLEEQDVADKVEGGYRDFYRRSHDNFTHFSLNHSTRINNLLKETQQKLSLLELDVKFKLSLDSYLKTVPI